VAQMLEPVSSTDVRRRTFIVEGMCCGSEVRQLTAKLEPLHGVSRLDFDLVGRRLTVFGAIAAHDVQRAVRDVGMVARVDGQSELPKTPWARRGRTTMAITSGVLLGGGLVAGWMGSSPSMQVGLLAVSAVAGGWFVVPRAWRAAANGALDMHVLMTLATVGAAVIGEWTESASVMFLFAVAQVLETYSMDRARHAITALMELSPTEATVRRDGREATVPVAEVGVGEVVIVRPGQKIPLDGVVQVGESSVNQAAITGESVPVDKSRGSDVFAGSLNEHGVLEIQVTTLAEDTTLARIIHAVEEAQASRAPTQGFIDRFSAIYTPAVVVAAALLFVAPPLLGLGAWSTWFYRALAMLVIACPCALVISTPVAIISGLAGAARAGILIKGGLHLENVAATTVVAFDKTGTLTEGRPSLAGVTAMSATADQVLRLAAALEHGSEHPLSRAVRAAAVAQALTLPSVSEFRALVGRGVSGLVEGERLFAGNSRLMNELGIVSSDMDRSVAETERSGHTAVVLATSDRVLGVLAIGDRVRPEAMRALHGVRRAGVRTLVMLTGDSSGAARAVAATLGIEDVRAGLLPHEKVAAIRAMVERGERVVFVGDGVNDAPALAAATVGVAMGVAGTDVALETADVALMADDLSKLPVALQASRHTLRIIKQNVAFSLTIKAVFLVLAIGGWATLWMAVASDMGSSLLVIANGLRARRVT